MLNNQIEERTVTLTVTSNSSDLIEVAFWEERDLNNKIKFSVYFHNFFSFHFKTNDISLLGISRNLEDKNPV